ncbi:MAG TPA: right-handed parallel beta-helix repeat-containing protein [Oligoflexia bacterium]|nr:right-handed parallel beta-helix repeat-containing protein [Oligoflexia bacterium]HMP47048.1 right-handed parallel beta-helix repeat-containing protein [Oligoflexia bacterium]
MATMGIHAATRSLYCGFFQASPPFIFLRLYIFIVLSGFFLVPMTVHGENSGLRPVELQFKECVPAQELCGSGRDEDCNGADDLCPGSDKDRDGYPDDIDCDDNDKFVYPGIAVSCQGSCGKGVRVCGASGNYSSCSCLTFCEASGSGRCYYVDGINGSDSNDGTFNSRLRSLRRLASYSDGTPQPHNKISLAPGDVVYLFSAVYDDVYQMDGRPVHFGLINVKGTSEHPITIRNYPGEHPVFSPKSSSAGFQLYYADWMLFEGLVVEKFYGSGVAAFDSSNLEFRNMTVRDNDGEGIHNTAGMYMSNVSNLKIHHSVIHDNYDRTNLHSGGQKTENSRNMVFFGGGNVSVSYSNIFQTPPITAPKTGACVVYKHGQKIPGGVFEVHNNYFKNCFFTAIGTVTYGGRFHHNLIIDSDNPISVRNHGDHVNLSDNIAEFNTIVNGIGLQFSPGEALEVNAPLGAMTFRRNIVIDSKPSYNSDIGGILNIDPYGLNEAHDRVVSDGILSTDYNCYHNTKTSPAYGFFSSNHTGMHSKGGLYSFSQWKALGFDANSRQTDPKLNSFFQPTDALCVDKGQFAN